MQVKTQICYELGYEARLNFGKAKISVGKLYAASESCMYSETGTVEVAVSGAEGMAMHSSLRKKLSDLESRSTFDQFVYYNQTDSELIQRIGPNEQHVIIEPYKGINWNVQFDSTRIISGLPCHLATGKFAGRTYRAWFTYSVAVHFGPYKFHGLPGMILHLVDQTGEVEYRLISYQLQTCKVLPRPKVKAAERITHREYVARLQKQLTALSQRAAARAQLGDRVQFNLSRNGGIERYDGI